MPDGSKVRRILLIEDNREFRSALSLYLKSQGIEVVEASNGFEGLNYLIKEEFHGVLCDIDLPNMSGFQCIIEAQLRGMNVPFAFVTGIADHHHVEQAMRLGAIDFLQKPFDSSEALAVAETLIEIGARRRKIVNYLKKESAELFSHIRQEERLISMARSFGAKRKMTL